MSPTAPGNSPVAQDLQRRRKALDSWQSRIGIIKRARPSHTGPESSAAGELGTRVGACSGREARAGQDGRRDSGTGLTSTGLTPSPHTLTHQWPGTSWLAVIILSAAAGAVGEDRKS